MNLYAMILHYVFSKGEEDIDKVMHRYFAQLERQAGWGEDVVALSRSLLHTLLVKIGNGSKRWMTLYENPEWSQLLKVGALLPARGCALVAGVSGVEEGVFRWTHGNIVLPLPPLLLSSSSSCRLRQLTTFIEEFMFYRPVEETQLDDVDMSAGSGETHIPIPIACALHGFCC